MAALIAESKVDLDRRVKHGADAISGGVGRTVTDDDPDYYTHVEDTISNILTAVLGPYGTYSYGGAATFNPDARDKAEALLHGALLSWMGDAEDYTREPEPGEYGYEEGA